MAMIRDLVQIETLGPEMDWMGWAVKNGGQTW
jgi:hypothetical protein